MVLDDEIEDKNVKTNTDRKFNFLKRKAKFSNRDKNLKYRIRIR